MDFNERMQLRIEHEKKSKKSLDQDTLAWLQPYAEKLDIDVQELALNLHEQDIYTFDNIQTLLNLEDE